MHREICVKDFSGTTVLRILKFDRNIGYGFLCCVQENQHPHADHCLYLSIFLFLQKMFCHRFLSSYESQSSNFVYTYRGSKFILSVKTRMLKFILSSFFFFFPSLTPVSWIEKFLSNIPQELLQVGF